MKTVRLSILALLPLAALAGCGDKAEESGDDRSASGEVLEGTISDDMLPLEKLRSQPPLLEDAETPAGEGGQQADAAAASEEDDQPQEPATEAPAEPETFDEAFGEDAE